MKKFAGIADSIRISKPFCSKNSIEKGLCILIFFEEDKLSVSAYIAASGNQM